MSKYSSKKFPTISASIREREAHSRGVLRKAIRESSGMDRAQAWYAKRSYGWRTRHLLLTYALVRRLPYEVCERKCEEAPSPSTTSNIAKEFGFDITVDAARAWLSGTKKEEVAAPQQVMPESSQKEGFFLNLIRRFA